MYVLVECATNTHARLEEMVCRSEDRRGLNACVVSLVQVSYIYYSRVGVETSDGRCVSYKNCFYTTWDVSGLLLWFSLGFPGNCTPNVSGLGVNCYK